MIDWAKGLNENQYKAANTTKGVLLVLAGAGSGKTKMMTHRICHLLQDGVPASEILGITFTNKAAKEMRDRVISMIDDGMDIPMLTTFHSYGYTLLKRFGEELGYQPHLGICDDEDRKKRIKDCLKEISLPGEKQKADLSKDNTMRDCVCEIISTWKDNLLSIKDIDDICRCNKDDISLCIAKQVFIKYNNELMEENQVDFDDLISKSVELMRIPYIKKIINSEIKHVSVDEFQDTSVAQSELVELLSEPSKKEGSLCVVGDDYQSIYKFRGAKVENILKFKDDHDGCKIIMLGENYRSTGVIVNAAAEVIRHNEGQLHKELYSMNEEGERISVNRYETDKDEAVGVVMEIGRGIKNGKSPLDYAVLYRSNSMSRKIEDALISASIPYKIFGGVGFYQRKEVKDIVAYLRLAAGFNDIVALKRIANVPTRGLGPKSLGDMISLIKDDETKRPLLDKLEAVANSNAKYEKLYSLLSSFRRESEKGYSLEKLVIKIVNDLDYEKYLHDIADPEKEGSDFESRWGNVWQLIEKAKEFETEYKEDHKKYCFQDILDGFLENIALMSEIDTVKDKNTEYVSLMTMHKSKGLEFDTVFVIGCSNPSNDMDVEEERRLFYVAMTRAKKKLFLSNANTIFLYGNEKRDRELSRFIYEIPRQFKETASIKNEPPKKKQYTNRYTRGYEFGGYGW